MDLVGFGLVLAGFEAGLGAQKIENVGFGRILAVLGWFEWIWAGFWSVLTSCGPTGSSRPKTCHGNLLVRDQPKRWTPKA